MYVFTPSYKGLQFTVNTGMKLSGMFSELETYQAKEPEGEEEEGRRKEDVVREVEEVIQGNTLPARYVQQLLISKSNLNCFYITSK